MGIWEVIKVLGVVCLLSGCASNNMKPNGTYEAPYIEGTTTGKLLEEIPKLDNQPKITIAVYEFTDQTGQRKPSAKFSQLSSAVTQGPDVWVINALKLVSDGDWFSVVERKGLSNLVKERQ